MMNRTLIAMRLRWEREIEGWIVVRAVIEAEIAAGVVVRVVVDVGGLEDAEAGADTEAMAATVEADTKFFRHGFTQICLKAATRVAAFLGFLAPRGA